MLKHVATVGRTKIYERDGVRFSRSGLELKLFGEFEDVARPFGFWANSGVDAGTGMKMLASQAANEVLRHCRIGLVAKKLTDG